MFAVPPEKINGTLRLPVRQAILRRRLYEEKDMTGRDRIARLVTMAGVTKRKLRSSSPAGLFTGAFGLHQGLERVGAGVVPMSSGNTQNRSRSRRTSGATAFKIGTPVSYALHLAETAEMGLRC